MQASGIFTAWLDTRRAMRLGGGALARRHARLWRRLQPTLARTPALAGLAGEGMDRFPVTTPGDLRADYGRWNSIDLDHAALHAAAHDAEAGDTGEARPGIVAGYSTGSSGERGLFLASAAERAHYVGESLARLLSPRDVVRGARIALFLRANSALYSDVARTGRFRFSHFPLTMPGAAALAALRDFAPDILVAPPHMLVCLAQEIATTGAFLGLRRCFYGAEPMGDAERSWIATVFGVRPDPVYQATEGFLGASCANGRLHLNDDSLILELEPVAGTGGFRPVVTDLFRTSQPIVRVRLDDFIERDARPCDCGRAGRPILPVAGRVTDLWWFEDRVVTPREVAAACEALLPPPCDWIITGSPNAVELHCADAAAGHAADILRDRLSLPCRVTVKSGLLPTDPKRRRVRWADRLG